MNSAVRSGCAWRLLPHDFPPWKTVYHYFRKWRIDGTWERLNTAIRERLRVRLGRDPQPSAGVVDSQSVKTTGVGGAERGYDAGKQTKGRKRHILVDTEGFLLKSKVHSAGVFDRDGIKVLLEGARGMFPRLCHLWLDGGYNARLRLDAALYEPAPPREPKQNGRPRLKGSRLPNLSAVLEDPRTQWTALTVGGWYGGANRAVEVVSQTGVWYSTGLPAVPIRWVLIRDPGEAGEFESQALLCTDLSADPERIISWFARRWRMESTFQEVRQRLGFETGRHWSEKAIRRTAPALLALFSLVTLFADQYGARMPQSVRKAAWYGKEHPTFSDALAVVRKELWAAAKGGFSRVGLGERHGKSPKGVRGKANRGGLLCSVRAKVQLRCARKSAGRMALGKSSPSRSRRCPSPLTMRSASEEMAKGYEVVVVGGGGFYFVFLGERGVLAEPHDVFEDFLV